MGLLFPFQTITLAAVTYPDASILRNLKELGSNVQSFQRDLSQVWPGLSMLLVRREA